MLKASPFVACAAHVVGTAVRAKVCKLCTPKNRGRGCGRSLAFGACCWRRSEEYTLRFSEAEVLSYVEPTVWDARNRIIIIKLYTILIRSIVQRPGPALVRKRQKKGPRNIIR